MFWCCDCFVANLRKSPLGQGRHTESCTPLSLLDHLKSIFRNIIRKYFLIVWLNTSWAVWVHVASKTSTSFLTERQGFFVRYIAHHVTSRTQAIAWSRRTYCVRLTSQTGSRVIFRALWSKTIDSQDAKTMIFLLFHNKFLALRMQVRTWQPCRQFEPFSSYMYV